MSALHKSLLEAGQIIPAFTLPGADGMPYSPWDYKQREHLVLLFTRGTAASETRGLLRAFAQAYKTLREEVCAILAITPDTVIVNLHMQESLNLPFPLLARPQGRCDIALYSMEWRSQRAFTQHCPGRPLQCLVQTVDRGTGDQPATNRRDFGITALSEQVMHAISQDTHDVRQ